MLPADTSGAKQVLVALSIGIGFAVPLHLADLGPADPYGITCCPDISSLVLSYFAPKLFVGIAFDAGGVASEADDSHLHPGLYPGAADAIEGANVLS